MKSIIQLACLSLLLTSSVSFAAANDILGTWQTFDDKTGAKKALVKFGFDKKTKRYYGRIIKITPVPGYKPTTICKKCPGFHKNKKVEGLIIVWNLKPKLKNGKVVGYEQGKLIDPVSGKIYNYTAKLSRNKNILKSRAYAGTTVVGRNQSWIRKK